MISQSSNQFHHQSVSQNVSLHTHTASAQ